MPSDVKWIYISYINVCQKKTQLVPQACVRMRPKKLSEIFLIKIIPQHIMPSDHNTRVIKTVWTNVLGLYSQQSTPFKKQMGCLPSVSHVIDHFCLETLWSRVVTFLWARSKPGAVLKLCLKQTSSTPSNLRFLCSAKPMKQPSICIYACSKSHVWNRPLLQISEDDGLLHHLLHFLTVATVRHGGNLRRPQLPT